MRADEGENDEPTASHRGVAPTGSPPFPLVPKRKFRRKSFRFNKASRKNRLYPSGRQEPGPSIPASGSDVVTREVLPEVVQLVDLFGGKRDFETGTEATTVFAGFLESGVAELLGMLQDFALPIRRKFTG